MDPNRVGGPVNHLLSDGGMSTMIGGAKGVDHGLVRNLQRMQARTEVTVDRALIAAFREIGKICSAMKLLETVRKQAEEYYKKVGAGQECGAGQRVGCWRGGEVQQCVGGATMGGFPGPPGPAPRRPPHAPRHPRQAYDNAKSIKNKSQAAVLAAIVFLACRHTNNARTFKEICAVVPQASVKARRSRRCRALQRPVAAPSSWPLPTLLCAAPAC